MIDAPERQSAVMGFPSKTQRWSAASGALFVVLIVAATLLLGFDTPTYDDSPGKFAGYYAEKADEIELSVLLGTLAAFALVWFFGYVRWAFATYEMATRGFVRAATIAFGGGLAGVAVGLMAGVARQTAVVAQGNVEPGVIRALDLMSDYAILAAAVLLSVFLLAAWFIVRVTKVLPEWLAWLAMVGSVLGVVQSTLVLAPQGDNGVLGTLGWVWFGIFLIWVLSASVTLVRRV